MTAGLMPALAFAVLCLWNSSAAADFRLCNNTSSRVGIALGYKDAEAGPRGLVERLLEGLS